jgi:hypothetical protein
MICLIIHEDLEKKEISNKNLLNSVALPSDRGVVTNYLP